MEKKYQIALIVVVLAAIGAAFLSQGVLPVSSFGSHDAVIGPTSSSLRKAGTAVDTSRRPATAPPHKPQAILAADEQALVDGYSNSDARSVEDVRWLQQHGYPDKVSELKYFRMSDQVLADLARRGDQIAAIKLAQRQAIASEAKQPIAELFGIAAKGSSYALEQLAFAYVQRPKPNMIIAQGYYEAARLMGNYAAPVIDTYGNGARMSGLQVAASNMFGQAVIDRLNEMRRSQGLSSLPYQPRPGASQAFEILYNNPYLSQPSAPISVPTPPAASSNPGTP